MRWAVVIAKPGCEFMAERTIKASARYDAFVPYYQRMLRPTNGHGVKVGAGEKVIRPLWTGYLFMQVVPGQAVQMEGFAGVQSLLSYPSRDGRPGQPKLIVEGFVEALRASCDAGVFDQLPLSKRLDAKPGAFVRVTEGPFASFIGQIKEIDDDRVRAIVALSIFGRLTDVEMRDPALSLEVIGEAEATQAAA